MVNEKEQVYYYLKTIPCFFMMPPGVFSARVIMTLLTKALASVCWTLFIYFLLYQFHRA